MTQMNTIIEFEDHGQDFLRWTINKSGTVTKCEPFQASVWCGRNVKNLNELKVGSKVIIDSDHTDSGLMQVKYPIESISTVPPDKIHFIGTTPGYTLCGYGEKTVRKLITTEVIEQVTCLSCKNKLFKNKKR